MQTLYKYRVVVRDNVQLPLGSANFLSSNEAHSTAVRSVQCKEDMQLAPLEYEDEELEINAAEEELTIFVAVDSGAIVHVTPSETVPRGAVIDS